MEFEPTVLSDTEESLRADVREFLTAELESGYRPGLGLNSRFDPQFSRKLADHGWVGMTIPKKYGGHGRSAVERFVVVEELLSAGAPIGAHYITDRQIGPMLLRLGSEEQRRKFLPAICSGECWFSLGMSEPDSGSDLASVRLTAKRVPTGWLLHGRKIWTTGAQHNQYLVVLCRTSPLQEDRHFGLSQLIVELSDPHITISPIAFIDGQFRFNEVLLDGVFVPDAMVLGGIGEGWQQVVSELAYERSGPDRYLSTFCLLREFLKTLNQAASDEQTLAIGRLTAWFWTIRQMSLAVARSLDGGSAPVVESALVKDLGTKFEQEVVRTLRATMDMEIDPDARTIYEQLLAEAILTAPSFTLRGGTTELLRSVVAKDLSR